MLCLLITAITLFATFIWQHIGRKYKLAWKPTDIIDVVTVQLIKLWTVLGEICVWVSSFYTWIDPTDLLATLAELGASLWNLVFSIKAFVEAYITGMNLYDHSYLVSLGSATLVIVVACLVFRYNSHVESVFMPMVQFVKDRLK